MMTGWTSSYYPLGLSMAGLLYRESIPISLDRLLMLGFRIEMQVHTYMKLVHGRATLMSNIGLFLMWF